MESDSNQEEILTVLHHKIPFTLSYSLPVVTLTQDECRYIMAPVYRCGLSRAGIPAMIPTPIRNGPISMNRLVLIDLFIHMGVSHLGKLVTTT